MMHNMIGGFGSFFILWMLIGMLFCVVVFGGIIWLFARLLNKKTPTMPNTPQPQSPYQTYEQGYQSPQPPPETYQEGGMQYRYPQNQQPQYEQPQAQYPQEQEMPGQH
jgi:hypothetical protein